MLEDGSRTLVASDFGFSDPSDSPGNTLLAVKITSLPAEGSLKLDCAAVVLNHFVSAADLGLNKLVYAPAANGNGAGYASFSFKVQDNGGTAAGGVDLDPTGNTITFDVTSVNDAPVNVVPPAQTTNEDTALTFAGLTGISTSDVDAAPGLVEVTLSVQHGTLTTGPGTDLTYYAGGNGTAFMMFRGTLSGV